MPHDDDHDEVTGVTHRAVNGDVIALKIKHVERTHEDYRRQTNDRLEELEGHFKEKGMVTEMSTDIKIAKSYMKNLPYIIAVIFTIITTAGGAVAYMIHSAERDHDLQTQQKQIDLLQKVTQK